MKVSIVIPAYNAQKTIKKAINSVLKQNFPKKDFEIIVVNDGSTDKTSEILKSYDKQIKIINQKNQGAVRAANKGFKKAKGKYVIKLDADDYSKPNILKEMTRILDNNPEIDFVYCDYLEKPTGGKIKKVSTKNIFNTLSGGIMFKRSRFAREGFYRENIRFAEYDLLLRIEKKWHGYHIASPLFYYNRARTSLTGKKKWVKTALSELRKLHPEKIKEIKKIRRY